MSQHSKQPLVLGNWKMNGSLADNMEWVDGLKQALNAQPVHQVTLGVCPPFPYLYSLRQMLPDTVALGAQDVSSECLGAFTGETSAGMLKELQCRYVLVGHSERRARMAETDEAIARKFNLVKLAGLTPVLCVGETQEQRAIGQALPVITHQLQAIVDLCGPEGFRDAVIAYEPIWAIGSGQTATPADIEPIHTAIFNWLDQHQVPDTRVHVIYGGSLKPENSDDIFSLPAVDGGLIGGASLSAEAFIDLARAAERSTGLPQQSSRIGKMQSQAPRSEH